MHLIPSNVQNNLLVEENHLPRAMFHVHVWMESTIDLEQLLPRIDEDSMRIAYDGLQKLFARVKGLAL